MVAAGDDGGARRRTKRSRIELGEAQAVGGDAIKRRRRDDAAKRASSVMIKRILGAPCGGTTRIGQYGVDCGALRSILPRNGCGGGGSWLPSMVVVAPGEPGVPVTCCAGAGSQPNSVLRARMEALTTHGLARMAASFQ
jgi:hypothetical protein